MEPELNTADLCDESYDRIVARLKKYEGIILALRAEGDDIRFDVLAVNDKTLRNGEVLQFVSMLTLVMVSEIETLIVPDDLNNACFHLVNFLNKLELLEQKRGGMDLQT